jgi:hypothetical protein
MGLGVKRVRFEIESLSKTSEIMENRGSRLLQLLAKLVFTCLHLLSKI